MWTDRALYTVYEEDKKYDDVVHEEKDRSVTPIRTYTS